MPIIKHVMRVRAPRPRVFDLSRSIDLHIASTAQTEERAVAGVTSGLLGPGDEVTWDARHLGVRQRLTSRITSFDPPNAFTDSMVSGAFARFDHSHIFREVPDGTEVEDVFDYTSPLGPLGRLADVLFLQRYMTAFLLRRLQVVKEAAESPNWERFIGPD